MGQEEYANFQQDLNQIEDESFRRLEDFLNNLSPNIHCPLESNDFLINNNLALISGIVIFITGYFFIKSKFLNSSEIETSPLTSNSSVEQEIQTRLDNEENLDDILKQILTKEEYDQYQAELLNPANDFSENLQVIFDSFNLF